MSDHHVLISCPLVQDAIHDFEQLFETHGISYDVLDVDQQLTETELLDTLDIYDGVIVEDEEFTAVVFETADRLAMIVKWGIGTDTIDFDAAEREDVTVKNSPGAFEPEVAAVVLGYAILLKRELHRVDREVRRANWIGPRGTSLRGKTFGVVSVGNVGAVTARSADAHEMDVVGFDVVPIDDGLKADIGIASLEFEELFILADIVSLHCQLTPETERMVGKAELSALDSEGFLINTTHGRIVSQDPLADALEDGLVAGAALDVFEVEPLLPSSQLSVMENVVLGSDNDQNTVEAVKAVNERAVTELLELLPS